MYSAPFKVFVVEDNEWYNRFIVHNISMNPDYVIESFSTGDDLLQNLNKNPNVITLDYRLPDFNGSDLLKKIKEYNEEIEVIVVSEQENIETAVDLLKNGVYDYIVKSKDIQDRLLNTINNIRKNANLKFRVSTLQKEVQVKYTFQNSIIGNSNAIKKIFSLIEKAIDTNITVSITGETGTGKELVAKAIHYNSKRKDKTFVAVNMAAIPSELLESELFGHEKGAFTGAVFRRIGKFEEAHNGTLFLDEIGDLDLTIQAKLLRALQEKEITPVGSNKVIKTDCRIIVATNKNLKDEVKKGRFREDLYFRLLGLPIELPPLRERDKDVLIIAKYFIENFCKENELQEKIISNDAQKKILSYNFPGNIRELKSVIELAVVMSNNSEINFDDIILSTDDALPEVMTKELTLHDYNQRILKTYMKKYENNINLIAQKLDISQSTIYRMLKKEVK